MKTESAFYKSFNITDDKTKKTEVIKFELTNHASTRMTQRNIDDIHLQHIVEYADCYFKQGLLFFVLGSKNLPVFIDKKYYNTIMVVAGDSGQIITCYRNGNPHKYIKKKSKRFSRSQSQKAA